MADALELLKEWDEYLDTYNPYGIGGVSQFGSGALGMEIDGVKKRVKKIIMECTPKKNREIGDERRCHTH